MSDVWVPPWLIPDGEIKLGNEPPERDGYDEIRPEDMQMRMNPRPITCEHCGDLANGGKVETEEGTTYYHLDGPCRPERGEW